MDWFSQLLWTPVLEIAGVSTTVIEVVGFVAGAWCVWLLGRQNPWNWPIGLIQVLAYLFIFWQVGLFADSALQLVYLVLGLYGWWNWLRGRPDGELLAVRKTRPSEWIGLAVAGIVGFLAIYYVLVNFTTSTVPAFDAITTVLSLLATYGQTRKLLESWWLWIAADIIYIPLFAYKGLWLTSILYVGFLSLCIIGWRRWYRDLSDRNESASTVVAR